MQANKLKDKHDKKQYVNGQRNVWANMRQMERQRDRQTDRQTGRHAHTKLLKWQIHTCTKRKETNIIAM